MEPFEDGSLGDAGLEKFLNEILKETGLGPESIQVMDSLGWDCGYDENGENGPLIRQLRGNLLRTFFLGGAFERAIQITMTHVASVALSNEMDKGTPVTRDMRESYEHISQHILRDVMSRLARDAIEPFIDALYVMGKYQRNLPGEPDFACMEVKPPQE